MDSYKGKKDSGLIRIKTGPLSGFGSLAFNIQDELREFTRTYARGKTPEVVWDLSSITQRKWSSIAAMAALLSTLERMRRFTNEAPKMYVEWKPNVFAFWEDINFLDIIRRLDLLDIPDKVVGGYGHKVGSTNPNTKILYYPIPQRGEFPRYGSNKEKMEWKDKVRETINNYVYRDCAPLFERTKGRKKVPSDLERVVSMATAEMVLNSFIHGGTPAFVAVQRTSKRISVAVCDSGKGFSKSVQAQLHSSNLDAAPSEKQAILYGSFMRPDHAGLWDAIDEVTDRGGWVTISSVDSEVHWHKPMWENAKGIYKEEIPDTPMDIDISYYLGEETNKYVPWKEYSKGIHRSYDKGLRGARVTIEIPLL